MPRTLYLHCGPMKTGTSAFQAYLVQNPAEQLLYPETGRWPDGAHHRITFALLGRTEHGGSPLDPPETVLDTLRAEVAARDRDVVISSELLQPDTAMALIARLDGFDAVRLVLTIRHPLERAASAYNQDVKDPVNWERDWPDVYLRTVPSRFTTRRLSDLWSPTGLPIVWVNYHPADSTTARLCAALDLPEPQIEVPRPNRSMGGFGLIGLLAAHRLNLSRENRKRVFDTMRKTHGRRVWRGRSFPFSKGAARRFLDDIAAPDLDWTLSTTGFDLRGLYDSPPTPFRLTGEDIAALQTCFADIDLTANQQDRLPRILGRFQTAQNNRTDTVA